MDTLTCRHCGYTGADVRQYRNVWDEDLGPDGLPKAESWIALCSDAAACVRRMTAPTAVLGAVR